MPEERYSRNTRWVKAEKYHQGKIRDAQTSDLMVVADEELTHTELFQRPNKTLQGKFQGNISWYGETVKLDLEARRMIERISSKPQKYRLK